MTLSHFFSRKSKTRTTVNKKNFSARACRQHCNTADFEGGGRRGRGRGEHRGGPPEDDGPVKKLLRELNYKEERRRLRTGPPMFGEGTTQAPE
jgi:hypothetical protein